MSAKSTILFRFAEHSVDEDILNKALLMSTAVGIAVKAAPSEGKTPSVLLVRKLLKDLPDELRGVLDLQGKFQDRDMVLQFYEHAEGAKPEDMMPVSLLVNDQKKPMLVACVEGVASVSTTTKELTTLCEEALLLAKFDLETMYERMRDAGGSFQNALRGISEGEETHIDFHFATGKNLFFGNQEAMGEEKEWGWGTNSITGDTPASDLDTTGTGVLKELSEEDELEAALTGSSEPLPTPTVDPKKDQADPKKDQTHTTEAIPNKVNEHPRAKAAREASEAKAKQTVAKASVPASGGSQDSSFELITLPKGMREGEAMKIMMKHMDKPLEGWKTLLSQGKLSFPVSKNAMTEKLAKWKASTASAPEVDPKKTPVHVLPPTEKPITIPGPKPGETPVPSADPNKSTPVLDPREREQVVKEWMPGQNITLLDVDSEAVMDPTLLKDFTEKYPNVFAQIGVPGWKATTHWKVENVVTLDR